MRVRKRSIPAGSGDGVESPDGDALPSLQSRLELRGRRAADDRDSTASGQGGLAIEDPVGLFRHLEATGRFHRDSRFGRIFHPGKVAFRENQENDSLHVVIHGNHVSAHVDRVSPLGLRPERPSRYSARRAVSHNIAHTAEVAVRLLRGRQGDHRTGLDCEWVWDPANAAPDVADLLDPTASGWSVQMEARVTGVLDGDRMRSALGTVLGSTGHDVLRVVDCPDDASIDEARHRFQDSADDLRTSPPLRARLARHPGGDLLMLRLNHAASDGFGALQVLRSIAAAYRGDADDAPLPEFMATRTLPVRPTSAPVSDWARRYRTAAELVRDRLARPARIAPDQPGDEPGYGYHLERMSVDETGPVVDPDRPGTSRNVLVAALHLAIGDWNLEHGNPGGQIGVLVPVNLRPPDWRDENVGNFSVTARVSTDRRERAGATWALRAVTAQTTRNKRTRTGTALLAALDRSGLLPLWTQQSLVVLQPLTRNRLLDTAMLANLGSVEPTVSFGADAGETVDLWFSVPARTPLSLCIGAVTVSDRLHLVFRYPHRLFSPDAARRFAQGYLDRIREVAARRR